MTAAITGIVRDGIVVPSVPLPEGTCVEIRANDLSMDVPPDLIEEMMAWQQGSAEAVALVERLAAQEGDDEAR